MNQAQLLGFIIEQGKVTSGQVAQRFGISIPFAHQVLRRLEDKRILMRQGGPYRYTFELSLQAKKNLDNLHKDKGEYGWIFLLGLAVGLLVGFGSSKKDTNKEEKNERGESSF